MTVPGCVTKDSQAVEQGVQRLDTLVAGGALIGRIRNEQGSLVSSGKQDVGKRVDWLAGNEVTFPDCALRHCADGSR